MENTLTPNEFVARREKENENEREEGAPGKRRRREFERERRVGKGRERARADGGLLLPHRLRRARAREGGRGVRAAHPLRSTHDTPSHVTHQHWALATPLPLQPASKRGPGLWPGPRNSYPRSRPAGSRRQQATGKAGRQAKQDSLVALCACLRHSLGTARRPVRPPTPLPPHRHSRKSRHSSASGCCSSAAAAAAGAPAPHPSPPVISHGPRNATVDVIVDATGSSRARGEARSVPPAPAPSLPPAVLFLPRPTRLSPSQAMRRALEQACRALTRALCVGRLRSRLSGASFRAAWPALRGCVT